LLRRSTSNGATLRNSTNPPTASAMLPTTGRDSAAIVRPMLRFSLMRSALG
jgi:hypothetical protein